MWLIFTLLAMLTPFDVTDAVDMIPLPEEAPVEVDFVDFSNPIPGTDINPDAALEGALEDYVSFSNPLPVGSYGRAP